MMFVVCSIVVWCICAARSRRRGSSDTFAMNPTSPSEIKLKAVRFSIEMNAYALPSCVICLNEYLIISFETGAEVTKTSCDHVFHTECLLQWMQAAKRSCPL